LLSADSTFTTTTWTYSAQETEDTLLDYEEEEEVNDKAASGAGDEKDGKRYVHCNFYSAGPRD
jgi:hypothetical protein